MSEKLSIEIDVDVHKIIEAQRTSFKESHNSILKRLLLAEKVENSSVAASWSGKKVTLPHGTEIEMTYNGVTHRGKIENGRWKVGNKYYSSPSDAASGVSELVTGSRKTLNGWTYWIAKTPGQLLWKKIDDIRKKQEYYSSVSREHDKLAGSR